VADSPLAQRSMLVTEVAWVFVILGGFAACVCLMQIIMIAVVFPRGVMPQIVSQGDALVREFARLIFNHIQLIFLLLLLIFATTFAAAIGLLKRENWARVVFIGLMGLGIAWNVASIFLGIVRLTLRIAGQARSVIRCPIHSAISTARRR
jgi:hypothetical protein